MSKTNHINKNTALYVRNAVLEKIQARFQKRACILHTLVLWDISLQHVMYEIFIYLIGMFNFDTDFMMSLNHNQMF